MIENYTRLSSRMFTATVVGKDKNGRKITEGRETYKTPSGVYEIEHWEGFVIPMNTQADETGQLTFCF